MVSVGLLLEQIDTLVFLVVLIGALQVKCSKLACGGDLPTMFLSIFTVDALKEIALRTTNYAYKDWGVPTARLDRDVNTTKRPIMSAIFPRRGESLPGHRCLVTKHKKRYQVTEHFVLAWVGAVMSAGAFFNFNGDNNRGINANYSNASCILRCACTIHPEHHASESIFLPSQLHSLLSHSRAEVYWSAWL